MMQRAAGKNPIFKIITRVIDKYSALTQEAWSPDQTAYRELLNALELAESAPISLQIELLMLLAKYCLANQNTAEADQYLQRIFSLLKTGEEPAQMANIYVLQGNIYRQAKALDAALEAYQNALALVESDTSPEQAADIHKLIGALFFEHSKYDAAITNLQKQCDLLRKTGKKSGLAKALRNVGASYLQVNQYDQALAYLSEARELYSMEDLQDEISNVDNYIGMVHFWKGDYPQALATYHSTLERTEKTDLTYANVLVQIGTTYQYLGDYAKSLQYLLESVKLRQEHHKGLGLASNYLCLGVSCYMTGDYDRAEKYYHLALTLYREQDVLDGVLKAQVNLGVTARARKNLPQALEYFLPVLPTARDNNDQYLYANVASNIAAVYSDQKDYHNSLAMYEEALVIKQKLGQKGDVAKIHISIAGQYLNLQDYAAAEKAAKKGISLAQELETKACVLSGYEFLSKLSELRKNYKKALAYYKQYMQVRETLINEKTEKNISEIKIKYDTLAKEKEAELLRQKALELEDKNKLIEHQKAMLQETLDKLHNSEIRYNFISEELSRNIRSTLIGNSQTIRSITQMIAMVAKSDRTNVLITGETGTGKEIVARNIHHCSKRGKQHFYGVNCSAVPENLFESQFFGHEKDAFTGAIATKAGWFEIANNCTLFLDEIGSLSFDQQAKLLRALEERSIVRVGSHREIPVDLRIISATNVNLAQKVEQEEFRRDLYHRLAIFVINIPPLREHKEDIPLLLKHFVGLAARTMNKKVNKVNKDVISFLMEYDFPGNVRELRNMVERAVLVSDSSTLHREHFLISHELNEAEASQGIVALETMERDMILRALQNTGFNQTQAARLLGVERKVVARKIKKHKITLPDK
jgi:transcriptional regulator with GAF, ATPase, and Fis domain